MMALGRKGLLKCSLRQHSCLSLLDKTRSSKLIIMNLTVMIEGGKVAQWFALFHLGGIFRNIQTEIKQKYKRQGGLDGWISKKIKMTKNKSER